MTKGRGSRKAGLAMAFKLIEAAELRWRAVNAPQLVARVRAGATFQHGNSSDAQTVTPKTRQSPKDLATGLDNISNQFAR